MTYESWLLVCELDGIGYNPSGSVATSLIFVAMLCVICRSINRSLLYSHYLQAHTVQMEELPLIKYVRCGITWAYGRGTFSCCMWVVYT
jgi:hypothetical protein